MWRNSVGFYFCMLFQKIRRISWKAFFPSDANTLDQDNYLKIITALYAFSGLSAGGLILDNTANLLTNLSFVFFCTPVWTATRGVSEGCNGFGLYTVLSPKFWVGMKNSSAENKCRRSYLPTGVAQEHPSEFRSTVDTLATSQPWVYKVAHPWSVCCVKQVIICKVGAICTKVVQAVD